MSDLNQEQYAAVTATGRDICIIAGPGSGKTRVLVERVLHLIATGVDPRMITIMTFTNAGAHEIRERLGIHDVTVGYVGTVHGFCFRLLQKHGGQIGYRPGAITLLDSAESVALLNECANAFGRKITAKALKEGTSEDAVQIWAEYRNRLKRNNLVDYDQVLEDGLRVAGDAPPIDHLLVDEAQDSGALDWEVFHRLPAENRFIVGDMDQSIFGFRGAEPELLRRYAATSLTLMLQWNYRSGTSVAAAANALIGNNRQRLPKIIVSMRPEIGEVRSVGCEDGFAEPRLIATCVYDQRQAFGTPWNEIAVLTRNNRERASFAEAMTSAGIPVQKAGAGDLPADWRRALLLLSLMIDPSNPVHNRAWRAVAMKPEELRRQERQAAADGRPLPQVLPNDWRNEGVASVPELFNRHGISMDAVALVRKRIDLLPHDKPTPSDLLHDLWNHQSWNDRGAQDGVAVLTIHAAKGREWDAVIIGACEEGVLPGKGDIEEERRLMFVAVTRARRFVTMTYAMQRRVFFKTEPSEPSRFLKEMGL